MERCQGSATGAQPDSLFVFATTFLHLHFDALSPYTDYLYIGPLFPHFTNFDSQRPFHTKIWRNSACLCHNQQPGAQRHEGSQFGAPPTPLTPLLPSSLPSKELWSDYLSHFGWDPGQVVCSHLSSNVDWQHLSHRLVPSAHHPIILPISKYVPFTHLDMLPVSFPLQTTLVDCFCTSRSLQNLEVNKHAGCTGHLERLLL